MHSRITSQIGDIKVNVRIHSFDIQARCSCGAPVAGHHRVMDWNDDTSESELADFFIQAFAAHVEAEHSNYTLVLSGENVEASVTMPADEK